LPQVYKDISGSIRLRLSHGDFLYGNGANLDGTIASGHKGSLGRPSYGRWACPKRIMAKWTGKVEAKPRGLPLRLRDKH
jgi:hypothetical protein